MSATKSLCYLIFVFIFSWGVGALRVESADNEKKVSLISISPEKMEYSNPLDLKLIIEPLKIMEVYVPIDEGGLLIKMKDRHYKEEETLSRLKAHYKQAPLRAFKRIVLNESEFTWSDNVWCSVKMEFPDKEVKVFSGISQNFRIDPGFYYVELIYKLDNDPTSEIIVFQSSVFRVIDQDNLDVLNALESVSKE